MKRRRERADRGQGLVEYALILALVAVVVIVILTLLGPAIGQVFSQVLRDLQPQGVISGVSAERTGGGSGNDVVVTITVSANTTVTVTDSQGAAPVTNAPCNGNCQVTLLGVGFNAGTVTAAAGGTATAGYPPKP
jgi:pilus assembly protein Flp/PilA